MAAAADLHSPLGLIAGSGNFPIHFAESAKEKGLSVVCLAHRNESDPRLEQIADKVVWIRLGELGKIIKTLRQSGCRQVAMAGGISRPKIFGGVKLDWRGAALIKRVRSIKDDIILRGIAEEIEKEGISVISAAMLLEEFVPRVGRLTKKALSAESLRDAAVGWQAAKLLGKSDTGQTVVVKGGVIAALEAVEGTDAAIKRGATLAGKGVTVVKVSKPQQDLRLDLPSIGSATVETLASCGAAGLVLEAGKSLILSREEVLEKADRSGIAIEVFESEEEIHQAARDRK